MATAPSGADRACPAGRTFIAYCRVSTDRQGRSGLGLEAQLETIKAYLGPHARLSCEPYVEVESGKKAARPELLKALQRCRETGASLLVAKLDRLSRNVPFLRSLIDGDVDVAFCDVPALAPGAMGRFILTQMAAVAELEAGLISERTRAALRAAKARGVVLGGDRGYRPVRTPDAVLGALAAGRARTAEAQRRRQMVMQIAMQLRADGESYRAIAEALNARGDDRPWSHTGVKLMLAAAAKQ